MVSLRGLWNPLNLRFHYRWPLTDLACCQHIQRFVQVKPAKLLELCMHIHAIPVHPFVVYTQMRISRIRWILDWYRIIMLDEEPAPARGLAR